jgi:HlyD family secretion protein
VNPRLRGVALLLGAGLSLSACSGGETPDVGLAAVERADVTEVVEAPATVAARASATLTAPADATVVEVAVSPGQQVAVGDLLVRLDSPAARDRLAAAREADASAARGAVHLDRPDLEAVQSSSDLAAAASFAASREAAALLPEGPARDAALERVTQAEAQYELARQAALAAVRGVESGISQVGEALTSLTAAQRVQTRAAVALAEQAVAALEVRSPIAGVVQLGGPGGGGGDLGGVLGSLPPEVQAQAGGLLGGAGGGAGSASVAAPGLAVGAPVRAGDTLATVVDVGELSLAADVDETDVLRVAPGAPATAELDSLPGVTYDATVTAVDLQPTTSAGGGVSYRVRLALGAGEGPDGAPAPRPRPGMSAVVDLVVASVDDAVAVPVGAVQRGVDGAAAAEASVWVDEGGRAERRVVRLGPEGDDLVVVESGVRPGERVVVRGADTVQAGQELPPGPGPV